MTSKAIEVERLQKSYRRRLGGHQVAVDDLTLEVPTGGVFGFLGPNGSGKTTTIRCLLGLVRPDKGSCAVLGAAVPSRLASIIGRVGSIVETPTFFGGFSGRRNLQILAYAGGVPYRAVDSALERVGLAERAGERPRSLRTEGSA